MQPDSFRQLVRRVLKEEIEKTSATGIKSPSRVPEMDGNGVDPDRKNKRFASDANSKDSGSKNKMLEDLIKLVAEIDKDTLVQWDDHDDLMVNSRDLKYFRISPRWEDTFNIEMMTHNEDRIYVTGQDWEQVKEFVKVNLKNQEKQPTYVDKAYDKSYRNREDQSQSPDKGLNQKDKPKTLPLTNEPVKTTKNKDKNYTEEAPNDDDDDLPTKPMREPKDQKKQIDHKISEPVKLRKRKPDTKLTVK